MLDLSLEHVGDLVEVWIQDLQEGVQDSGRGGWLISFDEIIYLN